MIANSVPTAKVDIDIDCLGGITMFKKSSTPLKCFRIL